MITMDMRTLWIVYILLSVKAVISSNAGPSLVCYLAMYATPDVKPSDVDGSLCTHIILIGSDIKDGQIVPNLPTDIQNYYTYIPVWKKQSPEIKVLLSSTVGFGAVIQSAEIRSTFVETTAPFLRKFGFDGVDLDWEFPSGNQRTNFSITLEDLRQAFEKKSTQTHKERLLLSVAVSATVLGVQELGYDPIKMNRSVDFINMMSYDMFAFGVSQTGYNSPLFPRSGQRSYAKTVNAAFAANYWVSLGMDKSKVMIGIPTYGYSFVLDSPQYHDIGDPATGAKLRTIRYPEACTMREKNFTRVFDDESMVPYLYYDRSWATYDDLDSVLIKSEWIKEHGFGGAMTFDLNCDDYLGICHENTTFPLHRVIKSVFQIG